MLSSRIALRCCALGLLSLVACSDDPSGGTDTDADVDAGGEEVGGADVDADAGSATGCAAAAECGHVLRGSAIGHGAVVDVAVTDHAYVLGAGGLEVYALDGGERIGAWAVSEHRFAIGLAVDGDRALVMSSTWAGAEGGAFDPPWNPDPVWAALTGHVLDVSTPSVPILEAEFVVPGALPDAWLAGVLLAGDTALVEFASEEGAPSAVFDLAQDPPAETARFEYVGGASDIVDVALVDASTVVGVGYAFGGSSESVVLRAYDVSGTDGPTELASRTVDTGFADRVWPQVAWTGDRVVMTWSTPRSGGDPRGGAIGTFSLEGLAPGAVATWDGDAFFGDLFTTGGHAFLVSTDGVVAYDISGDAPVEVAIPDALHLLLDVRPTPGRDTLTAVVDDVLHVVDVTDPSAFTDIASVPLARLARGNVTDLVWVGDVLVTADGPDLRVHDGCGVNGGDGVVLASGLVDPWLVSGGSRLAVESDGSWQMYDFSESVAPDVVAVDVTDVAAAVVHDDGMYAVVDRGLVVIDGTGAERARFELDPDADAPATVSAMALAGDRLVVFPGPGTDLQDPQGSSVHLFDVSDPLAPVLLASHRFAATFVQSAWLLGDTLHVDGRVGSLSDLGAIDDWADDERPFEVQRRQLHGDRWIGTRYGADGMTQQLVTWRGDEPEVVVAELTDTSQLGRMTALGWAGGLIAVGRGVVGFDLVGIGCATGD